MRFQTVQKLIKHTSDGIFQTSGTSFFLKTKKPENETTRGGICGTIRNLSLAQRSKIKAGISQNTEKFD